MTSSTNGRTPAPVDQEGALDFNRPAKPQKRKRGVIVQMSYHGALVSFHYHADTGMTVHELEQCIDTMLGRPG